MTRATSWIIEQAETKRLIGLRFGGNVCMLTLYSSLGTLCICLCVCAFWYVLLDTHTYRLRFVMAPISGTHLCSVMRAGQAMWDVL